MSTIIEFKSGLSSVDCVYRTVKEALVIKVGLNFIKIDCDG